MSNRRCADMYRRGTMRDLEASTTKSNVFMVSPATFVRCHIAQPPSVEEYEAWLAANPVGKRGHSNVSAAKLRRAVLMRRGGQSLQDISAAVGMNIRNWLVKLPPELAA